MHNRANVTDPDEDRRIIDPDRFRHDRRDEALAMIDLWFRSTKPDAGDELRYWRAVLRELERQAFREQR